MTSCIDSLLGMAQAYMYFNTWRAAWPSVLPSGRSTVEVSAFDVSMFDDNMFEVSILDVSMFEVSMLDVSMFEVSMLVLSEFELSSASS
jgi:hypothetical protein